MVPRLDYTLKSSVESFEKKKEKKGQGRRKEKHIDVKDKYSEVLHVFLSMKGNYDAQLRLGITSMRQEQAKAF